MVIDFKEKSEVCKCKFCVLDDDIVFWHNGFSVNLGGYWNNKDEFMFCFVIIIDLSKIFFGFMEFRVYLCFWMICKVSGIV